MIHHNILTHEFVEHVPDKLKEGTIYVSVTFATAIHKCCCGCGNEVVTPLSPTDWKLMFDGQTISLEPSIGNWNFPCQSHYWIKRNRVIWVGPLTHKSHIPRAITPKSETPTDTGDPVNIKLKKSIWERLKKSIFGK